MNSGRFYEPPDTPEAMGPQIPARAPRPGRDGSLRLVLRRDGEKTVVAEQFSEVPLHVQRALHYDESCPGMAHLYVISVSGGVLQGDRYRIDIMMERDSMAHVTTQGATRVYGMDSGMATQVLNVTLEEGAYLELVPDQIIPYRNSRFYQRASLDVHDSATLVYSEILTPGRVAMGESFEYDACRLKTVARDQHGSLRMVDSASIEPGRQEVSLPGIMGNRTVMGTAYVLTPADAAGRLHGQISSLISGNDKISGGVSAVSGGAGLLARILANRTDHVRDAILGITSSVRMERIGTPFQGVRKS